MIGGLRSCSFIDFPGRLSAVIFLRGCNLRCPYCHNLGLLDAEGPSMGLEELVAFLSSRRGLLDGVVISGGEPTLWPGLRSLIEAVRALGYEVKLDTNGTRPEVLSELIGDGLLDYVALDLKDDPAAYAGWLGMREDPEVLARSLDIVKASGVDHELRTTVVPSRHDDEVLGRMARWAAGCRRWILQPCRANADVSSMRGSARPDVCLEEIASRLRRRHGVACHSRAETSRRRESNELGASSP